MSLDGDSKAEAALRQQWLDIAGGWEPPAEPELAVISGKVPGVGFLPEVGASSCWEGGNVLPGCARVDREVDPFGPGGNGRIDPVLAAKRWKGGDISNTAWPQGFFGELFQNNYLTLTRMWEAGALDTGRRFSGQPTLQEMYDLAFTTPRKSSLYERWLLTNNPEVSTDPRRPAPSPIGGLYRYVVVRDATFGTKLYYDNTKWAPGPGMRLYAPDYPHVLGPEIDEQVPPKPEESKPQDPPAVPPPASPTPGQLSAPEVRVEELRRLLVEPTDPRDLSTQPSIWLPGQAHQFLTTFWSVARPFAVEALRFYRLLRRKLGDERRIP